MRVCFLRVLRVFFVFYLMPALVGSDRASVAFFVVSSSFPGERSRRRYGRRFFRRRRAARCGQRLFGHGRRRDSRCAFRFPSCGKGRRARRGGQLQTWILNLRPGSELSSSRVFLVKRADEFEFVHSHGFAVALVSFEFDVVVVKVVGGEHPVLSALARLLRKGELKLQDAVHVRVFLGILDDQHHELLRGRMAYRHRRGVVVVGGCLFRT